MGFTGPLTGPVTRSTGPPAPPRGRRGRALAVILAAALAGSVAYVAVRGPVLPWVTPRSDVLLVGDSLLVAASGAVTDQSAGRARVTVLAASGASPCDMWAGYPVPGGGRASFRDSLSASRPRAVVLAFTGNPGFPGTGCVRDATGPYSLDALLAGYRVALTELGRTAAAVGARVYLAATPPRNPDTREGWDGTVEHGYNGDSALNRLLAGLAGERGWVYDDGAARQLSSAGGGWTVDLPCQPADGPACSTGRVRVRQGGTDPIHCDTPGTNGAGSPSAGSLRFAFGLLDRPLRDQGIQPQGLGAPGC